ncbi:helicase BlpT [Streptococcus suis]|uniref:helicase BlpT n=1 Tax=Streptococcus suis TaxID=1307 RepID=UPI001ABED469|nr:helicase BlpT [Streptococcus suis]MBO4112744.1 helicase BlpT [Streptococcus suis]
MEKTQIIQDVLALIQDLDRTFQADKVGTADEQRFQHNLTETTRLLSEARSVTNSELIAIEKFYRSTSFLVGLGDLRLSETSRQAWQAFDRYYYQTIREELKLYGGSAIAQV